MRSASAAPEQSSRKAGNWSLVALRCAVAGLRRKGVLARCLRCMPTASTRSPSRPGPKPGAAAPGGPPHAPEPRPAAGPAGLPREPHCDPSPPRLCETQPRNQAGLVDGRRYPSGSAGRSRPLSGGAACSGHPPEPSPGRRPFGLVWTDVAAIRRRHADGLAETPHGRCGNRAERTPSAPGEVQGWSVCSAPCRLW